MNRDKFKRDFQRAIDAGMFITDAIDYAFDQQSVKSKDTGAEVMELLHKAAKAAGEVA